MSSVFHHFYGFMRYIFPQSLSYIGFWSVYLVFALTDRQTDRHTYTQMPPKYMIRSNKWGAVIADTLLKFFRSLFLNVL